MALDNFNSGSDKIRSQLAPLNTRTVTHERFISTFSTVADAIQFEQDDSIIVVAGATGSGKTAVSKMLKQQITAHAEAIGRRPGTVPAVWIEARATESNVFRWRPLYLDWLDALHEPLMNKKVDIEALLRSLREGGAPVRGADPEGQQLGVLRKVIEKAVRTRQNVATLIDEAHHIAKVGTGATLHNQMNLLKSLANSIDSRIVLFGTGELIELLDQSPQLSRRVVACYFEPYRMEQRDLLDFANALLGVLDAGPLPRGFDLAQEVEFLWRGSCGLFGVAHTWVRRAYAHALRRGAKELGKLDLDATRWDDRTLKMIQGEIDVCDQFFEGRLFHADDAPKRGKSDRASQRKSRVGKRNPHRDPVGRDSAGMA